jgi:hypothetical protein
MGLWFNSSPLTILFRSLINSTVLLLINVSFNLTNYFNRESTNAARCLSITPADKKIAFALVTETTSTPTRVFIAIVSFEGPGYCESYGSECVLYVNGLESTFTDFNIKTARTTSYNGFLFFAGSLKTYTGSEYGTLTYPAAFVMMINFNEDL